MASKVNSKFVVILIAAILIATMIIGGLALFHQRYNAGRSFALGEEAYAAGNLKKSYDYFGRAVHKEPGNLLYVQKMEEVLLKLQPKNASDASDQYHQEVEILSHRARHHQADAQMHLPLLQEVHHAARMLGPQSGYWEIMGTSADFMWQELADSDPKRIVAKLYRGMSKFNTALQRTPEELSAAEQDVQDVLTEQPNNDLAWATLGMGQMAYASKLAAEGRSRTAVDEQLKRADETLKKAVQACPNGPETATVVLKRLLARREANKESVSEDDLTQAADRLIALLKDDSEPGLVGEAADLLLSVPNGTQRSIDVLTRYVQAHPTHYDKHLRLATLRYYQNELDQAEQVAQQIVQSEQLTTSLDSQLQFPVRKQAAGLLLDVQTRRWNTADAGQRPALLKAMEDARTKLLEFVTDSANDPQVLRADGKIAYAKGDYNKAASCFDRLVRDAGGAVDVEILVYSADCLEKMHQVGLAYERLAQALQAAPNNPQLAFAKARMEFNMGRFDDATTTIAALPATEREKPEVRQLAEAINSRSSNPIASAPQDPVMAAINAASASMAKGDTDSARGVLQKAYGQTPDNPQLLYALTQFEMRAGQPDKAREYLERGLKLQPDNRSFQQLDAVLKTKDSIEAIREFHKTAFTSDAERAISLLMNYASLARQQGALAKQLEAKHDVEGAAKATDLATRAKAEEAAQVQLLQSLAPNNLEFLEYQFQNALIAKEWDRLEQLIDRAKQLNADQAEGMFYRGRYQLARNNLPEAVRSLEVATDRTPYSAVAWKALAFAYNGLGNASQAQRAFEQSYKNNPNDLETARAYAFVLKTQGDAAAALRVMRSVHSLAPQDSLGRDLWLDLEGIAGDRTVALRTRLSLYLENPADRENARNVALLLGRTEPTRELILDSNGNPTVTEARWGQMSDEDKAKVIAVAKSDWRKQADEILDHLAADSAADVQASLQVASIQAALKRERGEISEGEQVLQQFIGLHPGSPQMAQMMIELARYQVQSNHFTEAIATFTEASKYQDPKIMGADRELSGYYMQWGLPGEAIKLLDKITAVNTDAAIAQRRVECLTKLKRFDDAEKALQQVKNGEEYINSMLAAGIAEGRGEELLAKGDAEGAHQKYQEQREALSRAEQQKPDNMLPRIFRAQSLLNEYRRTDAAVVEQARKKRAADVTADEEAHIKHGAALLAEALQALDRADMIHPDAPEVGMVRFAILKAKGDGVGATAALRRMLDKNPDDIAARRQLYSTYVEQRDGDRAMEVIDEAIRANPTLAIWHEYKGDVYRFQSDEVMKKSSLTQEAALLARASALSKSAESFAKAYDLAPATPLLFKLVDTSFMVKSPNCQDVADRLAAHPDDLEAVPILRAFYSRALNCLSRRDEALQQARLSYTSLRGLIKEQKGGAKPADIGPWFQLLNFLFPLAETPGAVDASAAEQFAMEQCGNAPDIFETLALARLWLASGDSKAVRAIELLRQAAEHCPADDKKLLITIKSELAGILLLTQNFQEAAATYSGILDVDPKNAGALNNLAYVMAENLNEPAKALPFAERAVAESPKDASVRDTLGWIYYLAGDMAKAQEALEKAIELEDQVASRLHLAEVFIKTRNFEGANLNLAKAANLSPDSASRQKIEALRDDIRQKRRTP